MSFHRNGLRELVQAGRRGRKQPLTVGEVIGRLGVYREDSKVLLTSGAFIFKTTRITDAIHCETTESSGQPMTIGVIRRFLNGWVSPGAEQLPILFGPDQMPLIDICDINGVCYLVVKERREPC